MNYKKKFNKAINHLKNKRKILFLTTSNRFSKDKEIPKSTILALEMKKILGNKVKIIDVTKLKIYPCEGNVSSKKGNFCGLKNACLKNKRKNPSGFHRCWASINNKEDELWKITKELFLSDAIIFFGSVRWGEGNSIYQNLIERLTFIENRHTSLKENNILKNKDAGIIFIGHNWNVNNVIFTQKNTLKYFGFNTPNDLSFGWQYTFNSSEESLDSYKEAYRKFFVDFEIEHELFI